MDMLILGVGAQKAGTTWLSHQLERAAGYRSLGPKELHYWDELLRLDSQDLPDEQAIQSFFADEANEDIVSLNHDSYFARIERALCLGRSNPDERPFVADITPAYAGLPRGVLRLIRREFELRELEYRVIYLMRDPVARIVSAFNMMLRRGGKAWPARLPWKTRLKISMKMRLRNQDFSEEVIRFGRSWGCQFRTRYELTVANLIEVFPPERLFFGFNERFSDTRQVQGLSQFFNLPASLFNPAEVVGAAGNKVPYYMPASEVQDELGLLYRSTYDAMRENFPEVNELWRHKGADAPGPGSAIP